MSAKTSTGQTLQELELLAQEDLEEFVDLMEDAIRYVTGQSIVEVYGNDFQEFDIITYYSDQIAEILIYDTAAGHRTVGDFVSLETFLHDDDGNMTKRTIVDTSEEIDYEWTEFDRLKSVESSVNGQMQEARYNIDGLRHRKTDKNGNSSEEYGVGIGTTASAPSSSSSNAPEISYVAGHTLLGAEIDGEFVYFLNDALSTVRDLVSYNSGTSQWEVLRSYEFDEYGNHLPNSGNGTGPSSPKTFVGGLSVNDDTADSGLFNMGHRNYAAGVLGRFISRDPIGHAGNLNLYAYPTNPVNYTDPEGLQPLAEPNPICPSASVTLLGGTGYTHPKVGYKPVAQPTDELVSQLPNVKAVPRATIGDFVRALVYRRNYSLERWKRKRCEHLS